MTNTLAIVTDVGRIVTWFLSRNVTCMSSFNLVVVHNIFVILSIGGLRFGLRFIVYLVYLPDGEVGLRSREYASQSIHSIP